MTFVHFPISPINLSSGSVAQGDSLASAQINEVMPWL